MYQNLCVLGLYPDFTALLFGGLSKKVISETIYTVNYSPQESPPYTQRGLQTVRHSRPIQPRTPTWGIVGLEEGCDIFHRINAPPAL